MLIVCRSIVVIVSDNLDMVKHLNDNKLLAIYTDDNE